MNVAAVDLSVRVGGRDVLSGVSLEARDGGFLGVIGPNGAGKTTLLRALAGLVDYEGEVRLGGEVTAGQPRRQLARLVAVVPQRPVLPPPMTVGEYILLGRTPHLPYFGVESHHDRLVAADVLDQLDLADLAERPLSSLSGGESQLCVLGRALAQQAPVLVLDEPTAALDIGHGEHVLELVDEARTSRGITVVAAMHDLTLAGQFAERLVLLAGGAVVTEGQVRDVLSEAVLVPHYGRRLRVVEDGAGGIAVLPRRREEA